MEIKKWKVRTHDGQSHIVEACGCGVNAVTGALEFVSDGKTVASFNAYAYFVLEGTDEVIVQEDVITEALPDLLPGPIGLSEGTGSGGDIEGVGGSNVKV